MVLPYLTYCNSIWGNSPATNLNNLLLLQKKIVRILTNSSYLAHTNILFIRLSLLKIPDIYKYHTLIFMFKISHHLLPAQFIDSFTQCSKIHQHLTRNSTVNFFILPHHTKVRSKSVKFAGPKIWNELPNSLKTIQTLGSFKRNLKRHIILSYAQH